MYHLINGDSNDVFFDVVRSVERDKIIIVTDPPFNINYKYNTYKDKMDDDSYYEMLEFYFKDFPSVVIHYPESLYKISFQIGKFPDRVISWVYNSNTPRQHRDIAFFDIKPDMNQVRQPYKNLNDKRIKQRIANGQVGGKLYDWWNVNQVKNTSKEKTKHPCQMPQEVMNNIIGILPKDAIIIDPFMGSGTTGLAVLHNNIVQNANRQFIGIEIDSEYYNISKKAMKDFEQCHQRI